MISEWCQSAVYAADCTPLFYDNTRAYVRKKKHFHFNRKKAYVTACGECVKIAKIRRK